MDEVFRSSVVMLVISDQDAGPIAHPGHAEAVPPMEEANPVPTEGENEGRRRGRRKKGAQQLDQIQCPFLHYKPFACLGFDESIHRRVHRGQEDKARGGGLRSSLSSWGLDILRWPQQQ
ncbi:hypothetical protein CKAN_00691200 [Cinnamomum micranthum f. kanehirae]|uniref:Uncharacterized protein n=1 Tax=Cinnamomum micranthum f. kanehirae TaxID=337451 RepID=A0A3S3M7A1_9MAGN|nr:hypothetical protein CKAN_00691200 [Cinnamomum micranthum f. kanehirae]